jgi:hypothetical protein
VRLHAERTAIGVRAFQNFKCDERGTQHLKAATAHLIKGAGREGIACGFERSEMHGNASDLYGSGGGKLNLQGRYARDQELFFIALSKDMARGGAK